MSGLKTPREDAELEAFLMRKSSIATDYDSLELIEPTAELDAAILAAAKVAAKPAAKPASLPSAPATKPALAAIVTPLPARPATAPMRAPIAETHDEDEEPPTRRPRWLVPAALAATALVAVGVGVNMLGDRWTGTGDSPFDGSVFAKRIANRKDAEKAAAAEAARSEEALVSNAEPVPPPPVFEAEGPVVQDLGAAIALIRKELLLANQATTDADEAQAARPGAPEQVASGAKAPAAGTKSAAVADAPVRTSGVIQPRERRLTKILELYDAGQQDLASDSLEIFLRDFEDDPISQRIRAIKP